MQHSRHGLLVESELLIEQQSAELLAHVLHPRIAAEVERLNQLIAADLHPLQRRRPPLIPLPAKSKGNTTSTPTLKKSLRSNQKIVNSLVLDKRAGAPWLAAVALVTGQEG